MGGTQLGIDFCAKYQKPCFVGDLSKTTDPKPAIEWIRKHGITVLGIGGPRASQAPEIYEAASAFLKNLLSQFP
jgi:hypothetical protein